jgi:hypothetical protein
MLVLATFISICIAAVLFLLRFLFAPNSDTKPAPGRVERISADRALFRTRASKPAPLIHFNSSRRVVYAHPVPQAAFATPERKTASR